MQIERYSLQGSIDACQNFIINAVKERISGWPNQVAPLSGPSPASPKLSPDEFAQKIDKIAHSTHPEVEMDFVINKRSPYW